MKLQCLLIIRLLVCGVPLITNMYSKPALWYICTFLLTHKWSSCTWQDVSSELYGPLMLTLSLIAVLLYGMKTSGHQVVSLLYLLLARQRQSGLSHTMQFLYSIVSVPSNLMSWRDMTKFKIINCTDILELREGLIVWMWGPCNQLMLTLVPPEGWSAVLRFTPSNSILPWVWSH